MKRTVLVVIAALSAALALPALSQAPQGPPQHGREGGRPGPPSDRFPEAMALRALQGKASLLLEQGKTDAGIAELRRVFDVDVPRESPVYEMRAQLVGALAITLTNAGRKAEAVETIKRLLAEVPPGSVAEANAWLDAGTVYRQAGMPEDALKAFDRSIELAQKLAKTRGPAGRPPHQPPGGHIPRPPAQTPRGDIP